MNFHEYQALQAEAGEIEKLLDGIPADHVIDRMGLESRKREIDEALAAQPAPSREPARARLTFRGKPIVESYGIFAEFGAGVVDAFSEAVAAIGASHAGPLGSRGALPGKDDFRMLITGTAPGSFGFEFEEAPADCPTLFPDDSPLEMAIQRTKEVMQASLGTDDELTEALSEADPRAIETIRKFLETLEKGEAVCSLEFKGDLFRFADVGQVRRSVRRLAQDNLHEEDAILSGVFQGVLPHRRTFEFQVSETGEVISGKVGKEVADAIAINHIIGKSVTINVHSRRVGEGRPKYVLTGYEEETSSDE